MKRKITAALAFTLLIAVTITQFAFFAHRSGINIAIAEQEKTVFLTFDDGPSDGVTPLILDILQEQGVKATFFIIGKNAERRKYLIRREHDEGHTVAVHSYSHVYKDIYSSPQSLIEDIDKCNAVIAEVTGESSAIYRFPGGSFGLSQPLISAVTAHGLRYVDWNASTLDAELVNPEPSDLIKAAITTPVNKQRIVLLAHDSSNKQATAQALIGIINYYKDAGYTFSKF